MLHSLLPIATVLSAVKTPLVVHAHGTDLFSEAPQSRLIRRLTRGVVDAADLLIVPSEWFGERVLERYPGARVFVSPSGGVDEDVFFPKGRVSESDEGFHIGFVSRLIQSKGWRVLLRAIELLRARNATLNFRVSFIGPREEMDEFIAARRDAKLDAVVSHRGEFEGKALAEWYRSFSVLVFPSLLPESLGLVGLESMSCGTPVVASRIGGIGSYLRDGVNGYCFEPGNAVQLADRLETLIRSSDFQRESFRRSCIDTASAYRSTEVGRKLSARLQSLVVDRIF